jgi:hypothetical protein
MEETFTVTIEREYFEEILKTKPLFVVGKFQLNKDLSLSQTYIPISSIVCIHPDNNEHDTYNVIISNELKAELLKIEIDYNRVYITK